MDTSFIPANVPHRFNNIGDEPLTIFWIYGETNVTRTFTETGETVQHLSSGDKVTK
jgi:mannose-6-phosphate isomerase-like protein (cupin superfamily)